MTDQQNTSDEQLRDEPAQTQEQYDFIINLAREANIRLTRDLVLARDELAQARDELAQSHIELRQIRKFWLNPAGAAQIRADLASAKMEANVWLDKLRQARARLSAAKERTKALYDIVTDRNRKLTQARSDLQDLQGANRALGQQVDNVTENREFWYKEAQDAEAERDDISENLKRMVELNGWSRNELGAAKERLATLDAAEQALQNERRLRQVAEHYTEALKDTMTGIHEALDECQVRKTYVGDGCPASARTRIFWLNQRIERAEALAQLVNEGTVALLEHMAQTNVNVYDAHKASELARQIREALDDNQA